MQNVYAQPGQSMQQVGGDCPDGWVVMTGQRPEGDYVANEAGEWVPAPAPIPQSVTPAQGLMALYILHEITEDDILTAIDTIGDATLRYQAQITYKKATVWERESESMGVVAQLLSLTESDLDEAFTLAATFTNL